MIKIKSTPDDSAATEQPFDENNVISYEISALCNSEDIVDFGQSSIISYNVEPGEYDFDFSDGPIQVRFYYISDTDIKMMNLEVTDVN